MRSGVDGWKLAVVEGWHWRHRQWRWLAWLHPVLIDWLIGRQTRKFNRRAAGIARARSGSS